MDTASLKESAIETLDAYLKSKGGRRTQERYMVLDAIFTLERHFRIEQLLEACKLRQTGISRATLFNNVKEMVQAGILRKLYFHDDPYYELSVLPETHHHMVCGRCNKVMEFESPELDSLLESIKYKRFQMDSATVYVTGICSTCAAQLRKQRKKQKLY